MQADATVLPHVLILYIFYMYIFLYVSNHLFIVHVLVPIHFVYCLFYSGHDNSE